MTVRGLLSAPVGVTLTLVVIALLFAIDSRQIARVRHSRPSLLAAAIGCVAVVVLVVTRFVEYA